MALGLPAWTLLFLSFPLYPCLVLSLSFSPSLCHPDEMSFCGSLVGLRSAVAAEGGGGGCGSGGPGDEWVYLSHRLGAQAGSRTSYHCPTSSSAPSPSPRTQHTPIQQDHWLSLFQTHKHTHTHFWYLVQEQLSLLLVCHLSWLEWEVHSPVSHCLRS